MGGPVKEREGGGGKEEKERKKERGEREESNKEGGRGDKRNAGACTAVFHHSTAFHFIPVGTTPRTPVFPPL